MLEIFHLSHLSTTYLQHLRQPDNAYTTYLHHTYKTPTTYNTLTTFVQHIYNILISHFTMTATHIHRNYKIQYTYNKQHTHNTSTTHNTKGPTTYNTPTIYLQYTYAIPAIKSTTQKNSRPFDEPLLIAEQWFDHVCKVFLYISLEFIHFT